MNAANGSLPLVNFDDILAPLARGADVQVPPAWGQGRATFGGLVAVELDAGFAQDFASQTRQRELPQTSKMDPAAAHLLGRRRADDRDEVIGVRDGVAQFHGGRARAIGRWQLPHLWH